MMQAGTWETDGKERHRIGILSDTHGLLRPEVLEALRGCSAILHGGDINRPDILESLGEMAPVYVVRGNNDGEWAGKLPETVSLTLYGVRFFMVHNKKGIPKDMAESGSVNARLGLLAFPWRSENVRLILPFSSMLHLLLDPIIAKHPAHVISYFDIFFIFTGYSFISVLIFINTVEPQLLNIAFFVQYIIPHIGCLFTYYMSIHDLHRTCRYPVDAKPYLSLLISCQFPEHLLYVNLTFQV